MMSSPIGSAPFSYFQVGYGPSRDLISIIGQPYEPARRSEASLGILPDGLGLLYVLQVGLGPVQTTSGLGYSLFQSVRIGFQ